jgi:hypothetical protein
MAEEFDRFLERDLVRHVVPHNPALVAILKRTLQLFHFQESCTYSSSFSTHFPLLLALYVESVIQVHSIPPEEAEEQRMHDLLLRSIPDSVLEDLEADFYWSFVQSWDGLKVSEPLSVLPHIEYKADCSQGQGSYSANNRQDHSFVLQTLSRVDELIQASDPDLTDHLLRQGVSRSLTTSTLSLLRRVSNAFSPKGDQINSIMFLHSWISVAFYKTFRTEIVLRFWDSLLSENRPDEPAGISVELLVNICASIVLQHAELLKTRSSDDILFFLRSLHDTLDLTKADLILARAYLFTQGSPWVALPPPR